MRLLLRVRDFPFNSESTGRDTFRFALANGSYYYAICDCRLLPSGFIFNFKSIFTTIAILLICFDACLKTLISMKSNCERTF